MSSLPGLTERLFLGELVFLRSLVTVDTIPVTIFLPPSTACLATGLGFAADMAALLAGSVLSKTYICYVASSFGG